MQPEIRRYLEEHGETYTTDALRDGLLGAGHDAAEVDAALREWREERQPAASEEGRRTFGRWAIGLHAAALALMALWISTRPEGFLYGSGGIVLVVLGTALLIGWAISRAIGRALLRSTALWVALIVPAVSAVLIGGSCFAMMGGLSGV